MARRARAQEERAEPLWKNRIVGYGEEPPDQLLANPRNYRKHPAEQARVLRRVLSDVGWVQAVVVNQRTGHLVDGHLRVLEALRAGVEKVPVVYVDLSEEEEQLVLATFDPIGRLARADWDGLEDLIQDVLANWPDARAVLQPLHSNFFAAETRSEVAIDRTYELVVTCQSEQELQALYDRLTAEGYQCRVLVL